MFYVIARAPGQQRCRSGFGNSRSVFRVDQLQPSPMPLGQIGRLHPEYPANLVGKRHMIGEVSLLPSEMCDSLRPLRLRMILAELILRPLELGS
jgi:hypothetical protein